MIWGTIGSDPGDGSGALKVGPLKGVKRFVSHSHQLVLVPRTEESVWSIEYGVWRGWDLKNRPVGRERTNSKTAKAAKRRGRDQRLPEADEEGVCSIEYKVWGDEEVDSGWRKSWRDSRE